MIVLVFGVAGSGKTTIGTALAQATGTPFIDADILHGESQRAKMASGVPLDDDDRAPWLERLAEQLGAWNDCGSSGIMGCSALKRAYRARLRLAAPDITLVYLAITPGLAEARVRSRPNHFMPADLVTSQFAILERPSADEKALVVAADGGVEAIVNDLIHRFATDDALDKRR